MKAYILGSSAITSQHTLDGENYLSEWINSDEDCIVAQEPSYAGILNPRMLRRMSKLVKMGVATAVKSLQVAQVENPGAIVIGTGLGCTHDTEVFLKQIIDNKEETLSPTSFIQSTHNTIAGQIALTLNCMAYNFTYSNRGHSFENALDDALLLLQEGQDNVLVGGADQLIDTVVNVIQQLNCAQTKAIETGDDSIPVIGEGAACSVLSSTNNSENALPYVQDLLMINKSTVSSIEEKLAGFLKRNKLNITDIDLLISGSTRKLDPFYKAIHQSFEGNADIIGFKKITGEYFTANAFGFQLGATVLKNQKVYSELEIGSQVGKSSYSKVLIYNHYNQLNHSFILLGI